MKTKTNTSLTKESKMIYDEYLTKEQNKKVGLLLDKTLGKRVSLYVSEKEFENMLGLKNEDLYEVVNCAKGYYPHIGIK